MSQPVQIHPPYIWFGGKRKVAPIVWSALGDVENYVEPFFGGGAVYLLRPHEGQIETINDYDGFVANFWRALQNDPNALADQMNYPVNEIDLEARHRFLCRMPEKLEFLERMKHDPDYYDVKRAAWWCWGVNAWIGGGWCKGEYYPDEPGKSEGSGICLGANKRPHLGGGLGIHRKRPHLGGAGQGIHRKLPHLGDGGRGIHRQRPHLGDGRGEVADRREWLVQWMKQLQDRMRNTCVCCGDWERVCTDGATSHGATVGIFLDPPYTTDVGDRTKEIYRVDCGEIANRVRDYCIARTKNHRYRIVLAGYDGEHNELEQLGWRAVTWKANGGFANFAKKDKGKINATRERLWISPSCHMTENDGGDRLFPTATR